MKSSTKRRRKSRKRKQKFDYKILILSIFIVIFIILNQKFNIISKVVLAINPIIIQKIEISIEENEIEIDKESNIDVKIFPENYSKSNLEWHSTDSSIIDVCDGKIIGKSTGRAKIYLTDGETKSNELDIECIVKLEDIIVENLVTQIQLGDIYNLEIKPVPENATHKELEFESNNIEVLSVDDNGNLLANAIGKSSVNIKDYKGNILKNFEIEVKKIPVEKIELDDSNIILGKNQTYIISAKVTPLEATYTDVEWKSSNKSVITIEDRKIKAIAPGKATITAITDNGDKEAVCDVTVKDDNPENLRKYANGNYNIRTGPSTDYKVLATTTKYEEIELLQGDKNGWKKVRNSAGIVGYTLIKSNYYLAEKPVEDTYSNLNEADIDVSVTSYHISNVPYLNQISLGYPTGCEVVSATMLLKYKGYDVSVKNVIENMKCGSRKHQNSDGIWYGANPFEEFVGNPSKGLSNGNYGVFAKPIVNAISNFAGNKVKNISGCSENQLFNYVSKGNPVIVWCVKNAGNLKEGVTWQYEDGSGSFKELVGEHCALLIGYDENYVYLNDPSAGENVKQSKAKFISNWKQLFSQAIIIE